MINDLCNKLSKISSDKTDVFLLKTIEMSYSKALAQGVDSAVADYFPHMLEDLILKSKVKKLSYRDIVESGLESPGSGNASGSIFDKNLTYLDDRCLAAVFLLVSRSWPAAFTIPATFILREGEENTDDSGRIAISMSEARGILTELGIPL